MLDVARRRRLHGRRGLKLLDRIIYLLSPESPPSRAAWIEMTGRTGSNIACKVAAFTGGVD